ncbi:MAG: hypothetical protein LBR22_05735 [Desulfovibrio sp.]|jgi:hypothetical protein|nr:hypothetical protein [Desulfovibrio sp.]
MLRRRLLCIFALTLFLFAYGSSNPILGTWSAEVEFEAPDNPLKNTMVRNLRALMQKTIAESSFVFSETQMTVINKNGVQKSIDIQYKKSDDGKNWTFSDDGGKTFKTLVFNGEDEMSFAEVDSGIKTITKFKRIKK